nr:LysR family transcriptional regulator [uncultured Lichenicoccus sp.]
MDRLTRMVVFVRAAELRSFTAAAAVLGVSPQMVGKHIAALEAHLGTQLLNRTTRRQSLTAAGRIYYDRCRAVLADAEAADAAVQALGEAPRGRLRVNAPVTFGTLRLAPLLMRYLATFPEVEVELVLSDRYVDIVEEGYDAVLRLGALRDSTLAARPLAPYRLVACAAPVYLARRGEPAQPEDLAAHECLGFVASSGLALDEWSFTGAGETRPVRIGGRYRVNDARVLRDAAVAGWGVILQAEAVVAEDLAAGRLVRVLPGWDGPVRPMHLLFPAARPLTPKLRAFVDMVVDEFGPATG